MGLPLCLREGERLQRFSCEYASHGSRNMCEHMMVCPSVTDGCPGDISQGSESESDESDEELILWSTKNHSAIDVCSCAGLTALICRTYSFRFLYHLLSTYVFLTRLILCSVLS